MEPEFTEQLEPEKNSLQNVQISFLCGLFGPTAQWFTLLGVLCQCRPIFAESLC